ncbi:DNA ligase/mRNA capping enzyme [Leucogyrophana mollusca]|uniref:DNA ligase/mRNA capping enzyme n=1 Tax=Leucogyrophana mollusca TaxID=85980 RepID=A0ACB8B9U8_9AGAM|nr:DNA ligase/mRNA capping enzyme [Leucogyrophana mollusca]
MCYYNEGARRRLGMGRKGKLIVTRFRNCIWTSDSGNAHRTRRHNHGSSAAASQSCLAVESTAARTSKKPQGTHPALDILNRWIKALRHNYSPIPRGTTAIILRLLFPEEDSHRKYDLQEHRLAQQLAKCLDASSFPPVKTTSLGNWNSNLGSGCLGREVLRLARTDSMNLCDINALLDELASTSSYSDPSIVNSRSGPKRSKEDILRVLYLSLPALDACYLTQIILKDLRPLLYPSPDVSSTRALLDFNQKSKRMLTKEQFMMAWDASGGMLRTYKARARLDEAAMSYEAGQLAPHARPQLGVPVPKSAKGRSAHHAIDILKTSGRIWAETKYDGERAQIHVRKSDDGPAEISIFSKSKRDSTLDRYALHSIILEALGSSSTENVILDAEMVAFSDESQAIDEFWRIRGLISRTAQGVRAGAVFGTGGMHDEHSYLDSCPSLHSNASDYTSRHLAIVFFDVLLVGNASLLSVPYSTRRSILESLINIVPGYSMLAERRVVETDRDNAVGTLRQIWAEKIADHEEGLVLKASEASYNDFRLPWVKLKKDYVPGYGDTIDLVVLAAAWDKHRARELRVSPSTLTTFYIGALANSAAIKANPNLVPHFVIYFTASYGLTREQLEEFNFWIRSDSVEDSESSGELAYTFAMLKSLPKPSVFVRHPLLVELCGAGFTKAPQSKYYELRFPRITKVFRPAERQWDEGLTLRSLQEIATESVGRDRRDKDLEDWCSEVWGKAPSPGAKSTLKRKRTQGEWEEKLESVDRKVGARRGEVEMSP